MSITWNIAIQEPQIMYFQHPVFQTQVKKDLFQQEFRTLLQQLDGTTMSDYIDFYYKPDIIDPTMYIFIDEDAKEDFFDFAVETDCIPSLKSIHMSENETEREARVECERLLHEEKMQTLAAQRHQKELKAQKLKKMTNADKADKKRANIEATIRKLEAMEQTEAVVAKIEKAKKML